MDIKKVKISDVLPNKENPRIIKDDKFNKLVQSIKDFPKMLEIRPIVVNNDMIVLGGNMRLKACKEAGLKEVFIIKADDLTEEQQKEFIIKDNVGFGEWDWEQLANEWDTEELNEWGLDVPDFSEDEVEELEEFPNLGNGEDSPIKTMSFTLSIYQSEAIEEAIKKAKTELECFDDINENSNGNALYAIIKKYINE